MWRSNATMLENVHRGIRELLMVRTLSFSDAHLIGRRRERSPWGPAQQQWRW